MNRFMKLNRKNKIAVSLLISYILVLMVPYIVHRISYVRIENVLMDEIKNYNAEHLLGRTNTLDETIANVAEMVNSIYLNSELQETASLKGTLTSQQIYQLSLNKSYIYGGFDFYIENAIVLYKNIDYYVGQQGSGHLKNFYNAHYGDRFSSFEEWYEFMTRRYYGEVVLHSDSNNQGKGSLYYILSYMDPGNSDSLLANIIVEFKQGFLLSENNNNKNIFFLINAENKVVVCNENEEFVAKANAALASGMDEDIIQMEYENQEKILITQEMKQSDLKYVSCISKEVFLEKIYNSRRNYIYTMLVCVLLGAVIILWGVKRHYIPIKNITKVLSKKYNNDSRLDEYQYLASVTNKIINEYRADAQYQMMEKKLAMNSFLLSILKGEELIVSDATDKLEYFGLKFKNDWFCVAYLRIKDYSNLFFEETEQENNLNLSKLIIENIYSDMLKDKCEFAFCDNDKSMFLVLSIADKDELSELEKRIKEAQLIVEETSNIYCQIALSDAFENFENITMCYVEANKIMQYCYTQNSSFVSFKDVSDENIENAVEYMYHATIEQKLINYLMYGKYEKAEELLREIIKNNFDPTNSNFLQSKCLFFDIAATVFKVIQEKDGMGEFISINKGRLLANIDSYESNAQIQDEFLEIFKSICDSTIQNISNNTKRLSENILEFVKYNFSNPNISVAFISEQFNVSPNYVSMVFKKETGIPLSEYINSVRIEHAKDLLKNTHMKASEVAEKVGFSSVRTFSRVFNSLEGISPGEYRKQ